jgi:hypothetical protein
LPSKRVKTVLGPLRKIIAGKDNKRQWFAEYWINNTQSPEAKKPCFFGEYIKA